MLLAEMIDVKGMKAQGNQVTKLKVKEIVLTHPIEGDEPWPEDQALSLEVGDGDDIEAEEGAPTIEWDMTKGDDEDVNQASLFE